MGCHSHDDRDSRYPVSSIDLSVFYSCGSIQVMDNDLHTHARTHSYRIIICTLITLLIMMHFSLLLLAHQ